MHGHNPRELTLICLYTHEKGIDLHLRGDFRDCSHAVVFWQGVVVEHDPLRQPQLVWLSPVAGQRVHLGHVLVRQNEVVSWSVHISSNLWKGNQP